MANETMRAAVATRAGGPEVLEVQDRAIPVPGPGQVLIRVRAFGLNRAELFTRQGDSPGVTFPRILGIEAAGEVADAPGGEFEVGTRVVTLMGGMGRYFDGGYAQYTCVPAHQVVPIDTGLPWEVVAATPEMFQTTWGSLTAALALGEGETLLIRGGTSSIGMTAARLGQMLGAEVWATTRNPNKAEALTANGVSRVLIDRGQIATQVKALRPRGVDKVLELIGATTLKDSLRCARRQGGVVCMTGILGGAWQLDGFEPLVDIPSTVCLTAYGGDSDDLDRASYAVYLDEIEAGRQAINLDRTFRLDEIVEAHRYMEDNRAAGKLVVFTN